MKRMLFPLGGGLAVLLLAVSAAQASDELTLVWSDEFDYTGLPDPAKWSYDVGGHGWGNNESQYYTADRLENARVENGVLIIEALREPDYARGNDYTSARLVSRGKGDWLYGRFEISAKLPRGRGTWPAIWMLPTDWVYGGWPDSGEIDIMEHVGYDMQRIVGTVHTKAYHHSIGTQVGTGILSSNVDTEFHVYSLEWRPHRLDIFLDDVHYFSFANEGTGFATWPFDEAFHLIMNIAIGGSWGGVQGIDDSIFPQRMEVDYVRVYELADLDTFAVHSVPGSFEAEAFDRMSGVRTEETSDRGGGVNLAFLGDEDWMEYLVDVDFAGRYALDMRYASPAGIAGVTVTPEGQAPFTVMITEATGGWQSWETITLGEIDLPAGRSVLRIDMEVPGLEDLNINRFELRSLDSPSWGGYPIVQTEDGPFVDTGDFMGWLGVGAAPWVYSISASKWYYLPEAFMNESGAWAYIPR